MLQSNQPIGLKVSVAIGFTNRKNCLTFDGDPVPDADSGSLFHFHQHDGVGDLGDLLAFLTVHNNLINYY